MDILKKKIMKPIEDHDEYIKLVNFANEHQTHIIKDFGEYYQLEKIDNKVLKFQELNFKINELENWFIWYDIEVIKSIRRGTDIKHLHKLAEKNAEKLKKLREEVNG